MAGGRPKSKLNLTEQQINDIYELYTEGASDVEVKAFIHLVRGSFSNDLWDRWLNEEDIFSETIKRGRLLSEAYWEKLGRKNLMNQKFNYTGWYMNMKNRFKWTDRVDNTSDDKPINIITLGSGKKPE